MRIISLTGFTCYNYDGLNNHLDVSNDGTMLGYNSLAKALYSKYINKSTSITCRDIKEVTSLCNKLMGNDIRGWISYQFESLDLSIAQVDFLTKLYKLTQGIYTDSLEYNMTPLVYDQIRSERHNICEKDRLYDKATSLKQIRNMMGVDTGVHPTNGFKELVLAMYLSFGLDNL